jgi:hypothetical protein
MWTSDKEWTNYLGVVSTICHLMHFPVDLNNVSHNGSWWCWSLHHLIAYPSAQYCTQPYLCTIIHLCAILPLLAEHVNCVKEKSATRCEAAWFRTSKVCTPSRCTRGTLLICIRNRSWANVRGVEEQSGAKKRRTKESLAPHPLPD